MKLIGLAGRARSGKSSIADYLVSRYGWAHLAFANPLREFFEYVLDTPAHYMDIEKETPIPPHGKSYREMMQTLGTGWGRDTMRNDFWVIELQRRFDLLTQSTGNDCCIVVSDVRFKNEADWVRERGQLWHITRPDQDPAETREHSSELGIEPEYGETLICNSETLADLFDHVDYLLTP